MENTTREEQHETRVVVVKKPDRRQRRKKREHKLEKAIEDLKFQVNRAQVRLHGMKESSLNGSVNKLASQFQSMKIFSELYCSPVSPAGTNEQQLFLSTCFAPNFQFHNDRFPPGANFLHTQWTRYSALYPGFTTTLNRVENVSPDGDIVSYTMQVQLPLTRANIKAVYPHLLQNEELVQYLIGKHLDYEVRQICYFDTEGRIVRMRDELDLVDGWMKLLRGMDGLGRILESNMLDDFMIPYDLKEIEDIKQQVQQEERFEEIPPSMASDTTRTKEEHLDGFTEGMDATREATSVDS